MDFQEKLSHGLWTSFIDSNFASDEHLQASLLTNRPPNGHKVREDIKSELRDCSSFSISVAFITLSGLMPLLQTLRELELKGIPGRVLTTDYLHFSEPSAIRTLMEFKNIDVRMYMLEDGTDDGFHTKGFIFEQGDNVRVILGSSNLTSRALATSQEWNALLVGVKSGAFTSKIQTEFERLWQDERTKPAKEVIDDYELTYNTVKECLKTLEESANLDTIGRIEPNLMQREFLNNLREIYDAKKTRALLISATGTGKTYAAALAIRDRKPKRLLFVVHREQIARQARRSFLRVLGGFESDFGFLSGTERDYKGKKYVFATMLSVAGNLELFKPDDFDYIIIDEVHRAGASSYQKIMGYFTPEFWLGMTGSPDRPDGFDIYKLFENVIAYEIRLQGALENDLLCPFHYFGIDDHGILLNAEEERGAAKSKPSQQLTKDKFIHLNWDEIVDHFLENTRRYKYSGERVKGLVFVPSVQFAEGLAEKLRNRGVKALALSGDDPEATREAAVECLAHGSEDTRLDYIVTVDIFNEGVDIPEVNQVVLMRPTESPIIFVQQLGRGLRKCQGKEHVVILDFIGLSDKNFLIPIALSGDRSYNKEIMRRLVTTGRIPGTSSINFDAVSRERIYQAIDSANTNSMRLLKDAYVILKRKLNKIPSLLDYEKHGEIDATKFFQQKSASYNYHTFCQKVDPEYTKKLSLDSTTRLSWLSRKLGNSIRPSEGIVIQAIAQGRETRLKTYLLETLYAQYGFSASSAHLNSVEVMLKGDFERTVQDKANWGGISFVQVDASGEWQADPAFLNALKDDRDFKPMVEELCAFIQRRWETMYAERYEDTLFCLGSLYTYDDVCRLLDWPKLMPAQNIGGYCYEQTTKTMPIFVNYEKADDAIAYHDRFISNSEIISISKTNRTVTSKDALRMTKQEPYQDTRVFLFVRRNKNDDEAKAFYFLGEMDAIDAPKAVTLNDGQSVFELLWRLRHPVNEELYDYITGRRD